MEAYTSAAQCVNKTIEKVGKDIRLGMPLGLAKPNQVVNEFYNRAKNDPSIHLHILTALSLEKPRPKDDIEAKFLVPFIERLFGDYEELEYMKAIRSDSLPDNIKISEFYFKAGSMKNVPSAQQNYISSNYTFIARDLMINGINVLGQLVAEKEVDGVQKLSLGSNTDVILDIMPAIIEAKKQGQKIVTIGQVHKQMPFMYNRAMVSTDYFDIVVRNQKYNTTLFAAPNMSVPVADYMAGLYASTLIKDNGTLQIGIGCLGDAIVYACQLRHKHNDAYRSIITDTNYDKELAQTYGGLDEFSQGIYGASEMFVNGFMHLIKSGIVKRKVFDDFELQRLLNEGVITETVNATTLDKLLEHGVVSSHLSRSNVNYLKRWGIFNDKVNWLDGELEIAGTHLSVDMSKDDNLARLRTLGLGTKLKGGIHMHGGFFLGPQDFYQALRDLSREDNEKICMSSVGHINQLDYDQPLLSAQRKHARFINTGMMVSLSGAVTSDGLENGTVISGVGGQYNFVSMAHKLTDARSILCVRSTRVSGKQTLSNIVTSYGHTTIPRHLRDIIVTEYGIADLRGKSDQEVAISLIKVADSRFQEGLLDHAKQEGKVAVDYVLPESAKHNKPENILAIVEKWKGDGYFPAFPLGCDFTDQEIALGKSLKDIKVIMENPKQMMKSVIKSFVHKFDEEAAKPYLERISLSHPNSTKENILQHLLLLELEENGYLKPM